MLLLFPAPERSISIVYLLSILSHKWFCHSEGTNNKLDFSLVCQFIQTTISKVALISSLVGRFHEASLCWIAELFSGAGERQNVFEKGIEINLQATVKRESHIT
jgi:hypothetical protein